MKMKQTETFEIGKKESKSLHLQFLHLNVAFLVFK